MFEEPVWKPNQPSGSGDRRFAFSPKIGRQVAFSSTLEFDYWLLLEFDRRVLRFCEQPATAVVFFENRWQRSRFDFWVRQSQRGEFFVEIKYVADLRDPTSRAHKQILIQKIALRSAGKAHEVITDAIIWANPILINSLRTLLLEFDENYPKAVVAAQTYFAIIVAHVASYPGSTIYEVLEARPRTAPVEIYRLAVFDLIRRHVLDASLAEVALSPMSILRLAPEGGGKREA